MKLKDRNDVVQNLIESSYRELSEVLTKEANEGKEEVKLEVRISFWMNTNFLDADKNQCVRGVVDLAGIAPTGKVMSFKLLLDRALVLRKNEGTLENPKYGKQLGYEELRRTILHEIVGKGVTGLALGLAEKTKDQIEEFNKQVPENIEGVEEGEELMITREDIEEFNKEQDAL